MKTFLPFILLAALASGLTAQERPMNMTFNVLLWAPFETLAPGQAEPKPPDLWYFSGEEYVQVKGTWNVPTPELKFAGISPLVFGIPTGIVDGVQQYRSVASVALPEEARHYIFIFFQTEDGRYRVFPVDVGLGEMPEGSLKLINYGGDTIVAKVGERVEKMDHGDVWIVPATEAANFQLRMQLASEEDGSFRLVYRSSFAVSEEKVRMVFLIHRSNLNSGSWRVRPIAGFDTIDRTVESVDTEAMIRDYRENE